MSCILDNAGRRVPEGGGGHTDCSSPNSQQAGVGNSEQGHVQRPQLLGQHIGVEQVGEVLWS